MTDTSLDLTALDLAEAKLGAAKARLGSAVEIALNAAKAAGGELAGELADELPTDYEGYVTISYWTYRNLFNARADERAAAKAARAARQTV